MKRSAPLEWEAFISSGGAKDSTRRRKRLWVCWRATGRLARPSPISSWRRRRRRPRRRRRRRREMRGGTADQWKDAASFPYRSRSLSLSLSLSLSFALPFRRKLSASHRFLPSRRSSAIGICLYLCLSFDHWGRYLKRWTLYFTKSTFNRARSFILIP